MKTTKNWGVYLFLGGALFVGGLILVNLVGVNMLEDQIYSAEQQELLRYTDSRVIEQAPVTTNFLMGSAGGPDFMAAAADTLADDAGTG